VAGNQFEHHVAPVPALLADQHPVLAALPAEGQAHRDAEVGQFDGEMLGVRYFYRTPSLDDFAEVQGSAEALITQAVRAGFDTQGQCLERGRAFAYQNFRHWLAPRRGSAL